MRSAAKRATRSRICSSFDLAVRARADRPRSPCRLLLALAVCVALSSLARAARTERAEIAFFAGSYQYTFVAIIEGTPAVVHDIVTDYDHYARINDDVTASRVLERYPNGDLKRLLAVKQCILVFCFDLTFVEHVTAKLGHIVTTIVPGESSFESGSAAWQIEAVDATHTRISVHARQTPNFWIPPVIGPLLLEREFRREIAETCANIERLARGR